MPEPLPIPNDLINLRRAYDQAQAEVLAFMAAANAAHHSRGSDVQLDVEQGHHHSKWTDEEHAQLHRLRGNCSTATSALRSHPTMVQARANGCVQQTSEALKKAARSTE